MKLYMCAIFDRAVGAYMQPMFFRSGAEAIRSLKLACGDPKSSFCQNPEDYHMDILAVFEDQSGNVYEQKEKLISCQQLVTIISSDVPM